MTRINTLLAVLVLSSWPAMVYSDDTIKPVPPVGNPPENRFVRQKIKSPQSINDGRSSAPFIQNSVEYCQPYNQDVLENSLVQQASRIAEVITPAFDPKLLADKAKLLTELLETERTYLLGLTLLLDEETKGQSLFEKLLEAKSFKSSEVPVVQEAIRSLKEIREHSRYITSNLEKALSKGSSPAEVVQMENALLKTLHPELLKNSYKNYVKSYDTLSSALDRISKTSQGKKRIERFLSRYREILAANKSPLGIMGVNSLTLTPVQRLPRYELILKELTKENKRMDFEPVAELEDLKKRVQIVLKEINRP